MDIFGLARRCHQAGAGITLTAGEDEWIELDVASGGRRVSLRFSALGRFDNAVLPTGRITEDFQEVLNVLQIPRTPL